MKKIFLSLAVAGLLFTAACRSNADSANTTEEQTAATAEGTSFSVDTAQSKINWQAAHKGGLKPRFGTLKVDSGVLFVKDSSINAGSFIIKLQSLRVDPASTENDKGEKKSTDLAGHLLSADFFEAAKYPSVKFEITSVTPFDNAKDKSLLEGANQMVSGNLTIKDSTVNVTFPAMITLTATEADIRAKFTVDRSSWGLRYGAEGDPKDWGIQKDIELALDVKAQTK